MLKILIATAAYIVWAAMAWAFGAPTWIYPVLSAIVYWPTCAIELGKIE